MLWPSLYGQVKHKFQGESGCLLWNRLISVIASDCWNKLVTRFLESLQCNNVLISLFDRSVKFVKPNRWASEKRSMTYQMYLPFPQICSPFPTEERRVNSLWRSRKQQLWIVIQKACGLCSLGRPWRKDVV